MESKFSLEKKIQCSMARISRLDRHLVSINEYADHIKEELYLLRKEVEEYKSQVSK